MKQVAQKENIFFFLAIFAVLVAGDLIWWDIRQMGDEFENSASLMQYAPRRDVEGIDTLSQDIDTVETDLELELKALEQIE